MTPATMQKKVVILKPEEASAEFGSLLSEIIKELRQNESDNLEELQIISSALTVKHMSSLRVFSDIELKAINSCPDIKTLLVENLRHRYRWDDYSLLTVLMSSLNATKCLNLLHLFGTKLYSEMKLQQMHEYCLQEKKEIPEGYHKMITIVNKKYSSITKEEYDDLKKFFSQHCGVESYVMSPFSKAFPFNSIVIEWFIPVHAVSYMIETVKNNIDKFNKEIFLYLKISSTVIFDHRNNVSCNVTSIEGIEVIKCTESKDGWWYYSIAQ